MFRLLAVKKWNKTEKFDEIGQMLVPGALNDTKKIRKASANIFEYSGLAKPWKKTRQIKCFSGIFQLFQVDIATKKGRIPVQTAWLHIHFDFCSGAPARSPLSIAAIQIATSRTWRATLRTTYVLQRSARTRWRLTRSCTRPCRSGRCLGHGGCGEKDNETSNKRLFEDIWISNKQGWTIKMTE